MTPQFLIRSIVSNIFITCLILVDLIAKKATQAETSVQFGSGSGGKITTQPNPTLDHNLYPVYLGQVPARLLLRSGWALGTQYIGMQIGICYIK